MMTAVDGARIPTTTRGRVRPVLALIVTTALWGSATAGIKFGLRGFGPMTFLLIEFVVANLGLWVILVRRGYRRPSSSRVVIVLGLFEAMVNIADTLGLSMTGAANASVIYGLESVFVVLLARVFLREFFGRTIVLALLSAIGGLVTLEGGISIGPTGLGDLIIMIGVLSAAGYTIFAKVSGDLGDVLGMTAHLFAVAGLLVLPVAVTQWTSGRESFPSDVAPGYWSVAILVGVAGLAGGLLLYNYGISTVRAGSAGLIVNLSPVFGLVAAVVVLSEPLTPATAAGALLVAGSAVVVIRTESRPPPSTS